MLLGDAGAETCWPGHAILRNLIVYVRIPVYELIHNDPLTVCHSRPDRHPGSQETAARLLDDAGLSLPRRAVIVRYSLRNDLIVGRLIVGVLFIGVHGSEPSVGEQIQMRFPQPAIASAAWVLVRVNRA